MHSDSTTRSQEDTWTWIRTQMCEWVLHNFLNCLLTILTVIGYAVFYGAPGEWATLAFVIVLAIFIVITVCSLLLLLAYCFKFSQLWMFWKISTIPNRISTEQLDLLIRFVELLLGVFEDKASVQTDASDSFYDTLETGTWHWLRQLHTMREIALARGKIETADATAEVHTRARALDRIWCNRGNLVERLPHEPRSTLEFIIGDKTANGDLRDKALHYLSILTSSEPNN